MASSLQVENQSGLSNFIPVLVGDKETCAEMEILQQNSGTPSSSWNQEHSSPQPACKVLASRQAEFSELILDVAWSLKKPEQKLTSSHIQRSNCLFEYLMEKESTVILKGLYCSLRSAIDNNLVEGNSNSDVRLLQKNMDTARRKLARVSLEKVFSENCYSHSSENDHMYLVPSTNQVHHVSRRFPYLSTNACVYNRIGFINAYNCAEIYLSGSSENGEESIRAR